MIVTYSLNISYLLANKQNTKLGVLLNNYIFLLLKIIFIAIRKKSIHLYS